MEKIKYPSLGFGLGLRSPHYSEIIEQKPPIDWFEIISENFFGIPQKPFYDVMKIREAYPMVMHGVSLSIGSSDPLNKDYLKKIKILIQQLEPAWVSDHLCWGSLGGNYFHDLLPLPYTDEAITHVAERVKQVQNELGRRILLENVSSYISYVDSIYTEYEFLSAVANAADCLILLDINNIYVSAFNHGFDPLVYLNSIPIERVQQFHLAGHENRITHIIDTHDHPVIAPVWDLYRAAVQRFGNVSVMIERDDHIPPLSELFAELEQARAHYHDVTSAASTTI